MPKVSSTKIANKIATKLTTKQQTALAEVQNFFEEHGISPTYRELQSRLGYSNVSSVQQLIGQLCEKGLLHNQGAHRGFSIPSGQMVQAMQVPVLGKIAAGMPIEVIETKDYIEVPRSFVKDGRETFALIVSGDSMIDSHIVDGDIVVIRKQKTAEDGEIVAAMLDNQATLKKIYRRKTNTSATQTAKRRGADVMSTERSAVGLSTIELHSTNKAYKPIIVKEDVPFEILGVLAGVIRKI